MIIIQISCILLLFTLGDSDIPVLGTHDNLQSIHSCDFGCTLGSRPLILFDKPRFADIENIRIVMYDVGYEDNTTSANRITWGKVMLEAAGAAGFSFLLGFATYHITDDWLSAWCVAAPIGPAAGATLVGNSVMDPNGSFRGSAIGSITGAIIGGAIFYGVSWAIGVSHDIGSADNYWVGIIPAISFPIIGAVAGYNAGYSGVHTYSGQSRTRSDGSSVSNASKKGAVRIQLLSLKF